MQLPGLGEEDPAVEEVAAWLRAATKDPADYFGVLVRRAIDEVLDGPRTGRWDFEDLAKTEKTYVGTKVEILVRAWLELDTGGKLDLRVAGHEVDVKWAMNSGWQIPEEAIGEICLCIGGRNALRSFQVGVVRCTIENLNKGKNKDSKTTLSVAGREAMRWLVTPTALPTNFVAEMDPAVRERIISEPTIQGRVTALFRALPYTPIPRDAIRTIARTEGDPIRRTRADSGRSDPLGGMRVLSDKYGNRVMQALGYPPMPKGTWTAVPIADIKKLPPNQRPKGL